MDMVTTDKSPTSTIPKILFLVSVSIGAIAVATTLFIDFLFSARLDWSIIVSAAILAFNATIFSIYKLRSYNKVLLALFFITLLFVGVVGTLIDSLLVWQLGLSVTILTFLLLYLIGLVFIKCNKRWFLSAGYTFLMFIPYNVIVQILVTYFVSSSPSSPTFLSEDMVSVVFVTTATFTAARQVISALTNAGIAIICFVIEVIITKLKKKT